MKLNAQTQNWLTRILGVGVAAFFADQARRNILAAKAIETGPVPTPEASASLRNTALLNVGISIAAAGLTAYSWNDPYRVNKLLRGR